MLSSHYLPPAVSTVLSFHTNDEAVFRRRLVPDARSRMEHLKVHDSSQSKAGKF